MKVLPPSGHTVYYSHKQNKCSLTGCWDTVWGESGSERGCGAPQLLCLNICASETGTRKHQLNLAESQNFHRFLSRTFIVTRAFRLVR